MKRKWEVLHKAWLLAFLHRLGGRKQRSEALTLTQQAGGMWVLLNPGTTMPTQNSLSGGLDTG